MKELVAIVTGASQGSDVPPRCGWQRILLALLLPRGMGRD
jgi:hypothetical protein